MKFGLESSESEKPENFPQNLPLIDDGELVTRRGLPEYYELLEALREAGTQEEKDRIQSEIDETLKDSGPYKDN